MKLQPKHKHMFRNIAFGVLGTGLLVFSALIIWISTIKLPDFTSFDSIKSASSTKIYDRTGKIVLYDLGSNAHRTEIPVSEMGVKVKNATVAIEDANFYRNLGVEPKAILRALIADVTQGGAVQGGSTITQQVIKKSLLSDDKTLIRKLKEVILALKLDREYSKEDILGIYLNQNPYGGNTYGIEEASQMFFGKGPAELDLAQAAYVAAIPNAPTHYSPYGSHKDELDARKNLVLSREQVLGMITKEEAAAAKAEVVTFNPQQSTGIKAPHFVFYIKDYLEQKYGTDMVETGGLKVISTLDYDLQKIAEDAVTDYTTGAHKQGVEKLNAALVAIDPKTGQILTMVGSRNYFDKTIDGNFNVATALRQPGSSFKPYMYATAFEKGYTPDTVLFDVPTEFNPGCSPYHVAQGNTDQSQCYMPVDYEKYNGPMDIRTALGSSINVPAVKMLYMVGIPDTIKTATDMGITSLKDPKRYGLALVLGGGEVKLLDAVSAYGVFAQNGVRHPDTPILSVTDNKGTVLETYQDSSEQVLPKNVTLQISDVLSDNNASRLTFSPTSPLYFPDHQVAVKTGTTNDFHDLWTIGYTPSLVAGVWAGRNDNVALYKGITGSPIWHKFMAAALAKYPDETFEKPAIDPDYASLQPVLRGFWQGGSSYTIDTVTGKLATEFTPPAMRKEYVVTGVHDILYWINKNDPRGAPPANPQNDPQYKNWETAVQDWWGANGYRYPVVSASDKPVGYDDVHTATNVPSFTITSPGSGTAVSANSPVSVSVASTGLFPLVKMEVFLNNTYVGAASGATPILNFEPSQISNMHLGSNTLLITGTDSIGASANMSEEIIIQ
jgi:membrane peptidoglycan carboxypeptidase